MAGLPDITFQIGNFIFNNEDAFVLPNGQQGGIGDLGGIQALALNEFTGGLRTAQLYGPFPTKIEFKGIFFGANALTRVKQLDALRTNSQEVTLTYGPYSFDGVVEKCHITANYQTEVHYEMCFLPIQDNTQAGGPNGLGGASPAPAPEQTLANAQNTSTFQSQTPSSGFTFPSPIQQGVTNANNNVSQALNQAGGQIANIPPATIANLQQQVQGVQSQLTPLIQGTDPIAASAASDLNTSLQTISNQLGAPLAPQIQDTISAINPNLIDLATQYYENPYLWQMISDANGLPPDPFPVGDFPQLVIPQNNTPAPLTSPPTVLNG